MNKFVINSRNKSRTRIDDLNLLFNVDSSLEENENEFTLYRNRNNS
jgi:hypothetical protein